MEWYAINTAVNNEMKASLNLVNQNFQIYFPKYKKVIRHARKLKTVIKPLFPGYLFVLLDIENQNWSKINSTYGVKNLITMGLKPAKVSKNIIHYLKQREDKEGITNIIPEVRFVKGQKVYVTDGPFSGKIGVFDGLSDDKRIKVLFDILGRNLAVTIPAMSITSN